MFLKWLPRNTLKRAERYLPVNSESINIYNAHNKFRFTYKRLHIGTKRNNQQVSDRLTEYFRFRIIRGVVLVPGILLLKNIYRSSL